MRLRSLSQSLFFSLPCLSGSPRADRDPGHGSEAVPPELPSGRLPLAAEDHHDPGGGATQPGQGAPHGGGGRTPLPEVVPRLAQPGLHLHLGQDRRLWPESLRAV